MRKTTTALLFLIFISSYALAQNQLKGLDVKVGYNSPAFNFDDLYNGGVGVHIGILYPFYENLQFSLNTGYSKWEFDNTAFNLKNSNEYYSNFNITAPLTFIPITLGIKYYANNSKVRPYFSAEVGFFYYTQVTSGTYIWTPPQPDSPGQSAVIPEIKDSGFRPMLNFGAGMTAPLGTNLDLDFNVSMNGLFNAQAISGSNNSGGVEGSSSTIYFVSIIGGINYYFK